MGTSFLKNSSYLLALISLSACASTSSTLYQGEKDSWQTLIHTDNEDKVISLRHITPSTLLVNKTNQAIGDNSDEKDYSKGIVSFAKSPGAIDLGMNNTPVLDQGQFGTCVTFSTTAAMDTVLKAGDYISQQCTLELTAALGNNYWDGANSSIELLNPLKQYGLVKKSACPFQYPDNNASITIADYQKLVSSSVSAKSLQYTDHPTIILDQVKAGLRAGHWVTIGFMLMDYQYDTISVQGYDVKVDGSKKTGGLWACSQTSDFNYTYYCGVSQAGHEVVVVGYDDKQELLKIRNSWSASVGDSGDFYMTYSFFKTQVIDGTEIFSR